MPLCHTRLPWYMLQCYLPFLWCVVIRCVVLRMPYFHVISFAIPCHDTSQSINKYHTTPYPQHIIAHCITHHAHSRYITAQHTTPYHIPTRTIIHTMRRPNITWYAITPTIYIQCTIPSRTPVPPRNITRYNPTHTTLTHTTTLTHRRIPT